MFFFGGYPVESLKNLQNRDGFLRFAKLLVWLISRILYKTISLISGGLVVLACRCFGLQKNGCLKLDEVLGTTL